MDRRKAILWGLGAAQLVAGAVGYVIGEWSWNIWAGITGQVIFLCTFYLAGVWVALGRQSAPWRLIAVAIILTCLTWLHGTEFWHLGERLPVISPAVLAAFAAMRICDGLGLQVTRDDESRIHGSSRFQFSLRSILIWTATIAILFSLASLTRPALVGTTMSFTWQEILFAFLPIHLLITVVCVADLAIVLGMRRPLLGLALLLPVALAFFALYGWVQGTLTEPVLAGLCVALWFALSFLPLRLLGYRFGRCRPTSTEPPASGTPSDCPFHVPPDLAD